MLPLPEHSDPVLRAARAAAGTLARWHRGALEGAAHLPRGPALLVGNHGLFGLDTPVFFWLLHRATGRYPVGLADRHVFGGSLLRPLLARIGGVEGTRAHALELLSLGAHVVCYPGGAREVFKERRGRYQLRWERSTGFAHVAIAAQVPVVPFGAHGVDDTFLHLGSLSLSRKLGRYAAPIAVGLGPLPLPVKLRFQLGAPLQPPARPEEAESFKRRVQAAVEALLPAERQAPLHAHAPCPAVP